MLDDYKHISNVVPSTPKCMYTIYWPFDDYACLGAPFYFKILYNSWDWFRSSQGYCKFKNRKVVYLNSLYGYVNIQEEL